MYFVSVFSIIWEFCVCVMFVCFLYSYYMYMLWCDVFSVKLCLGMEMSFRGRESMLPYSVVL